MGIVRELLKPFIPMYISNWIFGIGIMEYPLGIQHPIVSSIYSLTIIITYCILSGIAYPYVMTLSEYYTSSVPIKIMYYSNILLIISIIVLGWVRSKGLQECIKQLAEADTLMETIGVHKNYKFIHKVYIIRIFCGFVFMIVVMIIKAGIILSENLLMYERILTVVVTNYPIIIIFVADSTYTGILWYVYYKLKKLNEQLRSLSTSTIDSPQHKRIIHPTYYVRIALKRNEDIILKNARQAHMKLAIACDLVNTNFGLQILLSIGVAFVSILANVHNTYMLINDIQIKSQQKIYKAFSISCIWIIYYALKIRSFSEACSCCQKKAIKTGDYINEFYDEPFVSNEIQYEIRCFNVQLIQLPIQFTAFGFINIDLTLIRVMIGSIITYLMIMIQLGKVQSTKNIDDNMSQMFHNYTYSLTKKN